MFQSNASKLMNSILGPASQVGVPSPDGKPQASPLVRVAGSFHIDGDVCADVTAEGNVIISGEARIKGNIKAQSVIIGGIVLGNIIAPDGITLLATSVVLGNVTTKHLRMDEGALLTGKVAGGL